MRKLTILVDDSDSAALEKILADGNMFWLWDTFRSVRVLSVEEVT